MKINTCRIMMDVKDCTSCSKPTDNKEFNCPPRMSDGRHFTDYRPRCAFNSISNYIIKDPKGKNGFISPPLNSYDFRQYMMHNSEALMKMNREIAFTKNMCGPCVENPSVDIGTMLPEQTQITCDQNACEITLNDAQGLGMGRQYFTRPPQDGATFDMRRQHKEPESCCANGSDDLQYFPVHGKVKDDYGRMAIPGGGKPLHGTSRTSG